ncbi:hypothetical protein [Nitriliruptor alkaliphilus]|uniref:hypothetical protein n=1 Tax=Nitriliruptor alkaliphilus TaxID=427918 RepID=UPI0006971C4C|nr:hypothetical protein [Nitriliruptor alkaliphilus]
MRRLVSRRAPAFLTAVALLLTACNGDGDDGQAADDAPSPQAAEQELAVIVASYDVAAGEDRRLLAGVLTLDAAQIAFGEVTFELGYLGDETGGEAPLDIEATARYLPVLGLEPEIEPTDQPMVLVGEAGTGVYEAFVDLEEPGFYGLQVTAELADGTTRQGRVTFEVLPEPEVPDVGDEAPRSQNLTIADVEAGDALPVSVDSRAQGEDDEVPDAHLHDTTIADALDEGMPVVVILSTPTYCVSAFCGPLTTKLAMVATEYEDTAAFVHIEVWRDFEARELNDAAAEWIQTEGGGNEPWVFLVDGDGTIQARWDNVVDVQDLEARLQAF